MNHQKDTSLGAIMVDVLFMVDGLLGVYLDFFHEISRLACINHAYLASYKTFWPALFRARAVKFKFEGNYRAVHDFLKLAVENDTKSTCASC